MKKGYLLSAIVGVFFFIILYAVLDIHFIISLLISLVSYFGAYLIIKNIKDNEAQVVVTPADKILDAEQEREVEMKKIIASLYQFAINSKDEGVSNVLKSLSSNAETIEKMQTSSIMIKQQKDLLLKYFLGVAYDTAKDYLNTDKINPAAGKKIGGNTLIIEREIDLVLQRFIELKNQSMLMDVKSEINSFKEKIRKL